MGEEDVQMYMRVCIRLCAWRISRSLSLSHTHTHTHTHTRTRTRTHTAHAEKEKEKEALQSQQPLRSATLY